MSSPLIPIPAIIRSPHARQSIPDSLRQRVIDLSQTNMTSKQIATKISPNPTLNIPQ